MSADIMAAHDWSTNGHLIWDLVRLGYLHAEDYTLDTTYGRGVWWKLWQPGRLLTNGWTDDPGQPPTDTVRDFRDLDYPDNSFDVVAFDPPYMPKGTPAGLKAMDERYGVGNQSPRFLAALMADGLTECARVTVGGGTILTKAGRGIDSGKLWRGDDLLVTHGEALGLEVIAQFRHLTRPRSQAHRGPQKSPRSNYSTLTVWRKPT